MGRVGYTPPSPQITYARLVRDTNRLKPAGYMPAYAIDRELQSRHAHKRQRAWAARNVVEWMKRAYPYSIPLGDWVGKKLNEIRRECGDVDGQIRIDISSQLLVCVDNPINKPPFLAMPITTLGPIWKHVEQTRIIGFVEGFGSVALPETTLVTETGFNDE